MLINNKFHVLASTIIFALFFVFFPSVILAVSNPVINEILVHPSSPNKEWVEFYNPDHGDLSNYYIDDDTDFTIDSGNSSKKKLSEINTSNLTFPYIELSSIFNNTGDHVVLFNPEGAVIDQYEYTKDPETDVSIGRSPDGSGEFMVLANSTKGDVNVPPPTAIPTPTAVPQNTPTPTKTPVPSKTPTPTQLPTPSPTPKIFPTIKSTPTPSPKLTPIPISSTQVFNEKNSSVTAVLAESTIKISSPSPLPKASGIIKKDQKIKQNAKTDDSIFPNTSPFFISFIGIIFLTICGILAFRSYKEGKNEL